MITCPYCYSNSVVRTNSLGDLNEYHCTECDCWFDDDDIVREGLRHAISPILNGTTEENPMPLNAVIGEGEAQGLSGLELPVVVSAFEVEGEGTIWFNIDGCAEPMNFDDLDTSDLKIILDELLNR